MIDFLFEHVPRPERPFPNLAQHRAEPYTPAWREFSIKWPFSEPVGFFEHCVNHGVPVQAITVDQLSERTAIYPVSVSFFDHSICHARLIPDNIKSLIRRQRVRPVLFYSEGDDPRVIAELLREQEVAADLPIRSFHLVSANSAADIIPDCTYFADDELLFRHRNRWHQPVCLEPHTRKHLFTCLNRTHKWWRASTMAAMFAAGWLDRAIWSYNMDIQVNETMEDSPISIYQHQDLYEHVMDFLQGTPYRADSLDYDQHNDHEHHVRSHFTDSYFQVILETHFDADGSGGTFLTEKTFKAIKNAQPFVIFGPAGSLAQLKDLGYRTFDHVIDNSYDVIRDNNQRWLRVLNTVRQLVEGPDLSAWYQYCHDDICHNQQIFMGDLTPRLNKVIERILA